MNPESTAIGSVRAELKSKFIPNDRVGRMAREPHRPDAKSWPSEGSHRDFSWLFANLGFHHTAGRETSEGLCDAASKRRSAQGVTAGDTRQRFCLRNGSAEPLRTYNRPAGLSPDKRGFIGLLRAGRCTRAPIMHGARGSHRRESQFRRQSAHARIRKRSGHRISKS